MRKLVTTNLVALAVGGLGGEVVRIAAAGPYVVVEATSGPDVDPDQSVTQIAEASIPECEVLDFSLRSYVIKNNGVPERRLGLTRLACALELDGDTPPGAVLIDPPLPLTKP